MNLFTYTAALEEINTCKYNKDLEVLIRKYVSLLDSRNNKTEQTEYGLTYKLARRALNLFTERSVSKLPDFVYSQLRLAQKVIVSSILAKHDNERYTNKMHTWTKEYTYEEFINLFEFDKRLDLDQNYYFVQTLDTIIGSNPIHFTIEWNVSLTSFNQHSIPSIRSNSHRALIGAIRLKQTLRPNAASTIIDSYLEYCIVQAKQAVIVESSIDDSIMLLKQQIKALKGLANV